MAGHWESCSQRNLRRNRGAAMRQLIAYAAQADADDEAAFTEVDIALFDLEDEQNPMIDILKSDLALWDQQEEKEEEKSRLAAERRQDVLRFDKPSPKRAKRTVELSDSDDDDRVGDPTGYTLEDLELKFSPPTGTKPHRKLVARVLLSADHIKAKDRSEQGRFLTYMCLIPSLDDHVAFPACVDTSCSVDGFHKGNFSKHMKRLLINFVYLFACFPNIYLRLHL